MKIIHTSDWHLGKKLYGRSRYEESGQFLDWLLNTIEDECADALLISGDIFDTVSPSNRALEQYYDFLYRISTSCCTNVIITAGNHDSPSLLNAPKELLKRLNVHVIGNAAPDLKEEVILLKDRDQNPGALVCAVPYLREKDIRKTSEGESPDDKSLRMLEGIKKHYTEVFDCAEEILREHAQRRLPVVAMGHIFVAGGMTVKDDGVREIYVGNLEKAGYDIFPSGIDYVALGHLHVPQKIAGMHNMRYSGSPIPTGFKEASRKKMIISVDFSGRDTEIKEIFVPVFRRLETVYGTLDDIREKIFDLKFSGGEIWAEVIYNGTDVCGDLQEIVSEYSRDSSVEILRIKNESLAAGILRNMQAGESLSDLNETDVFERCLNSAGISGEQRDELRNTFREAVTLLYEEDCSAE